MTPNPLISAAEVIERLARSISMAGKWLAAILKSIWSSLQDPKVTFQPYELTLQGACSLWPLAIESIGSSARRPQSVL